MNTRNKQLYNDVFFYYIYIILLVIHTCVHMLLTFYIGLYVHI